MLKRLSAFVIPALLATGLLAAPMASAAQAERSRAADTKLHLFERHDGKGDHRTVARKLGDREIQPFTSRSARNNTGYIVYLYPGYSEKEKHCTGEAQRVKVPRNGKITDFDTLRVECVRMLRP